MKTKASKATPSTTTVQAEPPSTATLALDAPEGALIQAQLYIGQPGGRYEREADALADRVVQRLSSGETPAIQPQCRDCEEEGRLQRKEAPSISALSGSPAGAITASPQITSQLAQRQGGGEALPEQTQAEMEAAFGADFSGVRVHADSRAAGLSRDLGARAFTHGEDVYFGEGEYRPQSAEGRRLLGHELVHVVQQVKNILFLSPDITPESEVYIRSWLAGHNSLIRYATEIQIIREIRREVSEASQLNNQEILDVLRGFISNEIRIALRDQTLANMWEQFRRYNIHDRSSNTVLIEEAERLDELLLQRRNPPMGTREQAAIARSLFEIAEILQDRIDAAPMDPETLLPQLEGISWDVGSPLGGLLVDISPFSFMDVWSTFLREAPSPPIPRPGPRIRQVIMGEETIVVERETAEEPTPESVPTPQRGRQRQRRRVRPLSPAECRELQGAPAISLDRRYHLGWQATQHCTICFGRYDCETDICSYGLEVRANPAVQTPYMQGMDDQRDSRVDRDRYERGRSSDLMSTCDRFYRQGVDRERGTSLPAFSPRR